MHETVALGGEITKILREPITTVLPDLPTLSQGDLYIHLHKYIGKLRIPTVIQGALKKDVGGLIAYYNPHSPPVFKYGLDIYYKHEAHAYLLYSVYSEESEYNEKIRIAMQRSSNSNKWPAELVRDNWRGIPLGAPVDRTDTPVPEELVLAIKNNPVPYMPPKQKQKSTESKSEEDNPKKVSLDISTPWPKDVTSTNPIHPRLNAMKVLKYLQSDKASIHADIRNALCENKGNIQINYTAEYMDGCVSITVDTNYVIGSQIYLLYKQAGKSARKPGDFLNFKSPYSKKDKTDLIAKIWPGIPLDVISSHNFNNLPAELVKAMRDVPPAQESESSRMGEMASKPPTEHNDMSPDIMSFDENVIVCDENNVTPASSRKNLDFKQFIDLLKILSSKLPIEISPIPYEELENTLTQLRNGTPEPVGSDVDIQELAVQLIAPKYLKAANASREYPETLSADEAWSDKQLMTQHQKHITSTMDSSIAYFAKLAAHANIHFDSINYDILPKLDLLVNHLIPYIDLRLKHGIEKMGELDPGCNNLKSIINVLENVSSYLEQLMKQERSLLNFILTLYEDSVTEAHEIGESKDTLLLISLKRSLLRRYAAYTQHPSMTDIDALPYTVNQMNFDASEFSKKVSNLRKNILSSGNRNVESNPIYMIIAHLLQIVSMIQLRETWKPAEPTQIIENISEKYEEVISPLNQSLEVIQKVVEESDDDLADFDDDDSIEKFDPAIEFNRPIQTSTLKDLEIRDSIGEGAFGFVYKGTVSGNTVAVKQLYEWTSISDSLHRNFGILMSDKPYDEEPCEFLVRHYGAVDMNSEIGIVMEYVPNGTLSDALHTNDEPLTWEQRYTISQEIIAGLFYLHAHQITHGNLKTLNILMTDNWHSKISDYGLSINHERPRKDSLHYTAPENAINKGLAINESSDIYSLGVILWEILKCEMPFNKLDAKNGDIDIQIESYWKEANKATNTIEHFPLPSVPPKNPEIVNKTYTLLAPMIRNCRQLDPAIRANTSQLMEAVRSVNRSKF